MNPIRQELSWSEKWDGEDKGLIWCWERGRQMSRQQPEIAASALRGELPILAWKGGVEKKLQIEKKPGCLNYLATWQGLRNDDLDVAFDEEIVIVCSKTGQAVAFVAILPTEE